MLHERWNMTGHLRLAVLFLVVFHCGYCTQQQYNSQQYKKRLKIGESDTVCCKKIKSLFVLMSSCKNWHFSRACNSWTIAYTKSWNIINHTTCKYNGILKIKSLIIKDIFICIFQFLLNSVERYFLLSIFCRVGPDSTFSSFNRYQLSVVFFTDSAFFLRNNKKNLETKP